MARPSFSVRIRTRSRGVQAAVAGEKHINVQGVGKAVHGLVGVDRISFGPDAGFGVNIGGGAIELSIK